MQSLQSQLVRYDAKVESLSNDVYLLTDRLSAAQDREATHAAMGMEPAMPRDSTAQYSDMPMAAQAPELEVVTMRPRNHAKPTANYSPIHYSDITGPGISDNEAPIEYRMVGSASTKAPAANHLRVAKVPPVPPKLARKKIPSRSDKALGKALSAYRAGSVGVAYALFDDFIQRYPRDPKADNARYWMGQCRYEAGEYLQAALEFGKMIKDYPRSTKLPDALLKLGLSQDRAGNRIAATQTLTKLTHRYPKSALAELARARLTSARNPAPRM